MTTRTFQMCRFTVATVLLLLGTSSLAANTYEFDDENPTIPLGDKIEWDTGQPKSNPGGVANTVQTKGTYTLDPASTFAGVCSTVDQGIPVNVTASAANGVWDHTHTSGIVKGKGTAWGTLSVVNGGKMWVVKTNAEPVDVK